MAIGNPITLTSNVASKTISVIATASQSLFTVAGGYRINEIAVFRNGVRLVDGRDFTARDGSTVTLLSAATEGDAVEFQVFDTFRVADAITPFDSDQTIAGNLNITGILSASQLGSVNFNVTSGIQTFNDVRVGGALTVAGVLTFDDVTNVDSVGYATFRSGVNVQGAGSTTTTLNVTGVTTMTGDVNLGGNLNIPDSITHVGDTNTKIRFPTNDTFTVETAGAETLRIIGVGGSIGINETTPDSKVDIVHSTAENSATENLIHLRTDPSGGYVTRGLFVKIGRDGVYDNSAAHYDIVGSSGNSGFHAFEVQGDEKLRITKDSQVAIGTATIYANANCDDLIVGNRNSNEQGITIGSKNQGQLAFADIGDNRAGLIHYQHTDDSMRFMTNGAANERLRIDSSGRVLIGNTSSRSNVPGSDVGFQIEGASGGPTNKRFTQHIFGSGDGSGPYLGLAKHRGTSVGGNTIVVDGDELGGIYFQGADGTNFKQGAYILAEVDGTPGTNDMPGALRFATTADGASSPTERLRITSTGFVGINETSPGAQLTVKRANTSTSGLSGVLKLKQGSATNGNRASLLFSSLDDFDVAAVNGVIETHSGTESNNVGRLEFYTKASGSSVAERMRITSAGQIRIPVNATSTSGKLQLGASQQLSIFQDSSNGYIANNDFIIANGDVSETLARFRNGGAVDLYHNNSKKFETKSDGVVVTGGIYLDGSGGTASANKLDDYEEGSFTITASGITNLGTLQTARYTKVGNLVTYMWNIYQSSNNMSWSAGSYFSITAFTPIANFHTSPSISWYKSVSSSDTQPAYFNASGDIVLNAAQSSVRHLWGFVTVEVQ